MSQYTKYLLTLDGKPAYFIGGQICYARTHYRGAGVKESELCSTTREARQLIKKSIEYREQEGFSIDKLEYGYIPIKIGE